MDRPFTDDRERQGIAVDDQTAGSVWRSDTGLVTVDRSDATERLSAEDNDLLDRSAGDEPPPSQRKQVDRDATDECHRRHPQ